MKRELKLPLFRRASEESVCEVSGQTRGSLTRWAWEKHCTPERGLALNVFTANCVVLPSQSRRQKYLCST